jgi:hypothetical protein
MCPEGIFRQTVAVYYMSALETRKKEDEYRKKAKFVKKGCEFSEDPRLEKLLKIRPMRRIEQSDMQEIWPDWSPVNF